MSVRSVLLRIVLQEDVNFLLTNRIPRLWLTQLAGRISRVRHPLVHVVVERVRGHPCSWTPNSSFSLNVFVDTQLVLQSVHVGAHGYTF